MDLNKNMGNICSEIFCNIYNKTEKRFKSEWLRSEQRLSS